MAEPFKSVDVAVIWAVRAFVVRCSGIHSPGSLGVSSCLPDDIINAINRLWLRHRITLDHVRVLRKWADAGCAPDKRDSRDLMMWREVMAVLKPDMQLRGIVAA